LSKAGDIVSPSITRSDVDFAARFGVAVLAVGPEDAIAKVIAGAVVVVVVVCVVVVVVVVVIVVAGSADPTAACCTP
jgi:hypothetical protein